MPVMQSEWEGKHGLEEVNDILTKAFRARKIKNCRMRIKEAQRLLKQLQESLTQEQDLVPLSGSDPLRIGAEQSHRLANPN